MKILFSNEKKIFNEHTDGIPYVSFDMLDRMGVPNLYSTRFISWDDESGRGVEGIRMAIMKKDDMAEAAPVCRANRDLLAHQLGSTISMELATDQKHTNNVYVATRREDLGVAPVGPAALHRQFVDGIVTDIPDALLTAFGGDCPPVYIVDPVRKAMGLVHAGWKGTLGKIPQVAIAQMIVKLGCDPADMYAAIGPGVCKDCYEMGDEVYDAFVERWSRNDADHLLSRYPAKDKDGSDIPGGKYHLDLREANKLTLLRAGVPADHIAVSNICTMCNVDTFYSYRGRRLENEQAAMLVNHWEK
ncbi:MAG: laccase domain-containing protein [Mogibacterium sp.]|nr:laccase domain-containing protein [Mogibacterium sp.]